MQHLKYCITFSNDCLMLNARGLSEGAPLLAKPHTLHSATLYTLHSETLCTWYSNILCRAAGSASLWELQKN